MSTNVNRHGILNIRFYKVLFFFKAVRKTEVFKHAFLCVLESAHQFKNMLFYANFTANQHLLTVWWRKIALSFVTTTRAWGMDCSSTNGGRCHFKCDPLQIPIKPCCNLVVVSWLSHHPLQLKVSNLKDNPNFEGIWATNMGNRSNI